MFLGDYNLLQLSVFVVLRNTCSFRNTVFMEFIYHPFTQFSMCQIPSVCGHSRFSTTSCLVALSSTSSFMDHFDFVVLVSPSISSKLSKRFSLFCVPYPFWMWAITVLYNLLSFVALSNICSFMNHFLLTLWYLFHFQFAQTCQIGYLLFSFASFAYTILCEC